jgi:hypothetical protein
MALQNSGFRLRSDRRRDRVATQLGFTDAEPIASPIPPSPRTCLFLYFAAAAEFTRLDARI